MLVVVVTAFTSLEAKELLWHKGSVVLSGREVVVGEIARASDDLILHRKADGTVSSFPAHKVFSFRFYDEAEDINRVFVTVAVGTTSKYFERVVSGKISVFRIQHVFSQSIDERDPEQFNYYVEEGKVVSSLKTFRKKFFGRITDQLDQNAVDHNHLDPNTKFGALSLIILYNTAILFS